MTDIINTNSRALLDTNDLQRLALREDLIRDCLKTIRVKYSGCGDEGGIECIHYMGTTDDIYRDFFGMVWWTQKLPIPILPQAAEQPMHGVMKKSKDVMEEMFYDVLEKCVPGWEINEGSYGVLYWDIKPNKIKLCHYQNVMETIYEEREGL